VAGRGVKLRCLRAVEPSERRRRLTLVAMCAGQGMILLDNTIVNVALPSIQTGLRVTPGNLEWVVNAYVLALAALILVGGTLGDRYGRKRIFLAGLAAFTVFSGACALAPDDPALIAFRALQGAGAALMAPLTLAILIDSFPEDRRTGVIGIWAAAAGIAFGMGPILGGLLIGLFDWSAVFWVNVPIGIGAFVLTLRVVRESRNPHARRLDPVGAVLIGTAVFLFTFGLIETNEHAWLSAYTLALLAAAVILLAGFLAWERRVAEPMVELRLFRSRPFVTGSVVYGISYLALAGMFFFVTLYFQNVKGWSALETGLSWIPLNAPFLAVTPFAGRIGARFGAGKASGTGVALAAVGTAGLATLDVDSSYWPACACFVLLGLGYGLLVPAVSSAAMGAVPQAHAGVGSGILNASRQIGAAVGLAALGSISVAAVSRTWDAHVAELPAGLRPEADALVQRVAGGEGAAVGRALGQPAEPALAAFMSGLHAGLWVAGAAMAAAAVLAFAGLRTPVVAEERA
jgi:MFS transporter, DHA2 family, methylenomycin A resistance protein